MSPLSDTTNLAPAMAGTDVITHVKSMILPTGITYAITLIFFGVLGVMQYHGGDADMSRVIEFSNALNAAEGGIFNINPLLLLPPVVVIVAVALKVPAIPGITLGIVAGVILGLIFQPGACTLGTIFDYGKNGYYFSDEALAMFEASLSPETSYTMTRLLESGGIMGMMSSVSMTIIAMMFGGIMEETHQLEVIVNALKKFAKGPAALVGLTEVTCVLSNATMPEQYISIVVPGRMYAEEYHKMGVHPAVLSSSLESAGTVTSALIPWNTCGVFIKDTLNIAPWGARRLRSLGHLQLADAHHQLAVRADRLDAQGSCGQALQEEQESRAVNQLATQQKGPYLKELKNHDNESESISLCGIRSR